MTVFVRDLSGHTLVIQDSSNVVPCLVEKYGESILSLCYLTCVGGRPWPSTHHHQQNQDHADINLQLNARLLGGKGGFGQSLRGKVSKKKKTSDHTAHDLYRTTDGRSVRSIRLAQNLAEHEANTRASEQKKLASKKQRLLSIVEGMLPSQTARFSDMDYLERSQKLQEEVRASIQASSSSESKETKHPPKMPKASNFFEGSD